MRSGRGSSSSPIQDVQIYRPGPYIALAILLLPAIVALGGAAVYLNNGSQIPAWLPFILLLWLPGLPVLWLAMIAVRTSAVGIAAGRPWSRWVEIYWQDIERAEQRGPLVRIEGAQGGKITFSPMLLREGGRLERHLLLRLPTHVLTGGFADKAQDILTNDIRSTPQGGYSGMLIVHTRNSLRWLVTLFFVISAGGAGYLLARTPFVGAATLGVILTIIAVGLFTLLLWTLQSMRINADGVSVGYAPIRLFRRVDWSGVELIEHSPREAFLRFRGTKRLFTAGPMLLSPAQATLLRGFLKEYAGKREIPMLPRTWLLPW